MNNTVRETERTLQKRVRFGLFRAVPATMPSACRLLVVGTLISMSIVSPQPAEAVHGNYAHERQRHPVLRPFYRQPDQGVGALLKSPWFQQQYMTGNWDGLRETLGGWGITPTLIYTTDLLGNSSGGRRQGFQYAGDLGAQLEIDLEKLWYLEGLKFGVSGSWRTGVDLSARDIGNLFTASQIAGGETIRLYGLYLEQSLLENRLNLLAGRIGAEDEFATSPLYARFVQSAFNSNPASLGINFPGLSSYPVATWGFRAKIKPSKDWYAMAGAYYSDPRLGQNSAHGVDFSIRDDAGVLVIGQIGYRPNQDGRATGLPGHYAIGGLYDSGRFSDFSRSQQREVNGNASLYVMVDQMVYREKGTTNHEGLTPFVAATFGPEQDRNTLPYFFMTGLVYQGLLPGRSRDVTAFGLAYGKFSKYLRGQDFEMVLEVTYEIELAPWLSVQPDLQYIINPNGTTNIPDALVLGMQWAINF